jgi:hypothetical protein
MEVKKQSNAFLRFLILDKKSGGISTTKFWANIGMSALVATYIYSVVATVPIDATVMLIFGTVVVGNRTAAKMIKEFRPTANNQG